jgi:hypothetical protein
MCYWKEKAVKHTSGIGKKKTELVVDVEHCRLHFKNLVHNHDPSSFVNSSSLRFSRLEDETFSVCLSLYNYNGECEYGYTMRKKKPQE